MGACLFFLNLHLYCTSAASSAPVVIMATLSLAARGLECCKSPFFWRIIAVDEFEANACMRAQVLNSRFWCSSDAATLLATGGSSTTHVASGSFLALAYTAYYKPRIILLNQEQQDSC